MSAQLTLRFSLEEMDYLRQALALAEMPGLAGRHASTRPLETAQRRHLLVSADRSLRARGLVGLLDADRRSINPLVAGLLRAYAQPQPALFLDSYRQDWGKGQWLYVFNEQVIFEQCEPEPGVLQFTILPTRTALQERLQQVLHGIQSEVETRLEEGQLTQELLEEGTRLAQQNAEEARALFAGELPAETARTLAAALHTPQAMHYLARWSAQDTRVEAALTILQGADQQFLLSRPDAEIPTVQVLPAGAIQVWSDVAELLPAQPPHTAP